MTNDAKPYIISRHDYEEGDTMRLELKEIIHSPGASISFSENVDLSDLCYGTTYPVSEPVHASGTVRNTADVLMMKALFKFGLTVDVANEGSIRGFIYSYVDNYGDLLIVEKRVAGRLACYFVAKLIIFCETMAVHSAEIMAFRDNSIASD